MNEQEIFNKAYLGLKSQNFKQSTNGGTCLYRGPNGLKCAIGHLVSDRLARKMDRYGNIEAALNQGNVAERFCSELDLGFVSPTLVRFLGELQWAHDNGSDEYDGPLVLDMESRLRNFADKNNLTVPE